MTHALIALVGVVVAVIGACIEWSARRNGLSDDWIKEGEGELRW